jgi:hypothetical protein
MDPRLEFAQLMTRRHFFGRVSTGIGVAALAQLFGTQGLLADAADVGGLSGLPHMPPTAKRIIYLFQSGGPSQIEMFDYKPQLEKWNGTDLPDSIRNGQRLTSMTAAQTKFPVIPSVFSFKRYGQTGTWVSELLPHTAGIVDDLCVIKSMYTEQINHDPAVTFAQTGFQLAGRPSMGAWVTYGLGSENRDLPGFVVMVSQNRSGAGGQPLSDRFWGTGFLPTKYQGVKLRGGGDPVLYISDPDGFERPQRERFIEDLEKLNAMRAQEFHDPEINTRIAQYEMAFQMQTSVPELTDLSKEPAHTFELYGEDARRRGSFASNCLMARRFAERGVRFIQLYHRGWDHHGGLAPGITDQCKATDQACAGLIQDLKERGMLDDTLVVWTGEFGRTVYCQGKMTREQYGRDHHPRCFVTWMAGGGIKPGVSIGETDDYSYNVTKDPVHVHDLNATILRCLGVDHTKLTYKYQGRHFRLTDVHGEVVKQALA